jgi:hypothetical protein
MALVAPAARHILFSRRRNANCVLTSTQPKFNDIVDALRDANIPTLARSSASCEVRRVSFWDRIPILSDYKRMYDRMTWEVSVLGSDYAKAQATITLRSSKRDSAGA